MVKLGCGKNLAELAGDTGPLSDICFSLITAAEAGGWTAALVEGARRQNTGNLELAEVARALGI